MNRLETDYAKSDANHAHAILDTLGVPRVQDDSALNLSGRLRLLQGKLNTERFVTSDAVRNSIECAFIELIETAVATHVGTLQRVNEQAANIFAVAAAQLASGAVKQETIVSAIADAIRSMPPDKLVEFVKAAGADVTNINVGRTLAQTLGDGSSGY